jgi:hypothetical protein
VAALLSAEVGAPFSDDPDATEQAILSTRRSALRSRRINIRLAPLSILFSAERPLCVKP